MPTKTFLNLPEEKQKNLITASEKEFSKKDFSSSSINQIIQDAGISRGSFYMYFKDKEDLYFYVLERHLMKIYQELLQYIDLHHGDFIAAFDEMHERIIVSCLKEDQSFIKNVFLNMRFATEKKMIQKPPEDVIRKNCQELLAHIDRTLYNYEESEALLDAFSLVMLITMSSVVYTLMNPEKRKRQKENYDRRLEIIRSGMLRKEK